jgi:homoaconitase/3-isopropylmalate dehydratase large subunit/3-isopropylmalate dehydratase small subunit
MSYADGFRLSPGKRVLFLTKDPDLIRKQLAGELDLQMKDLAVEDLLDEINTDVMTPAWVCFDYEPEKIARNAYAGLIVEDERLIPEGALADGGFEVIVSGQGKGVGSSRETAVQAEKFSGIKLAVAASFAPIHARNNINQGVLMAGHSVLERLQAGQAVDLDAFTEGYDPITRKIVEMGGLFPFTRALMADGSLVPAPETSQRPMTMCEKILTRHLTCPGDEARFVKPGDAVLVRVDGGYSHEFTTAQVHQFLTDEFGADYAIASDPQKFAVFEDHLIYADEVARFKKFLPQIQVLRDMQVKFQEHTQVRSYSAKQGRSPGICHQVAREHFVDPGDFIQATDSHTCMGGGSNAYTYGVGTTEYSALVYSGVTTVVVPESIRFELTGELQPGVTAKDVMLHILMHHAKREETLDRCMEFGGPGLATLSMDERATLANMATECTAKSGICEADDLALEWIAARREGMTVDDLRARAVAPDPGAHYDGGVHTIDLSQIRPLVAHPGDPDQGIPSDPKNGQLISELDAVKIDIAYGGSCTAGKEHDLDFYAQVMREALDAGRRVADGVRFFIQFGSEDVARYAEGQGYLEVFEKTGVTVIPPGCGACIGCGPGVSDEADQVSVSAINRNYKGRSGPGRLYLASPLTVAASAVTGEITAYAPGMFAS